MSSEDSSRTQNSVFRFEIQAGPTVLTTIVIVAAAYYAGLVMGSMFVPIGALYSQ